MKSHIGWNLFGLALPLLLALISIPLLIARIGDERFGMIALAWAFMSFAGILDLGIGRALTQVVSRLRGQKNTQNVPAVFATASRITLVAGLIGSVLIVAFDLLGGSSLLKTQTIPPSEIRNSIFLLAIALPAQAMSATYRGMNEAYMNFKGINILRVALGAVNFAGPLLISFMTTNLAWLMASLVVSRLAALFVFRHLAFSCLKKHEPDYTPQALVYSKENAKTLISFGGWVTVSSILSPLMIQSDRFMIASIISAAAVTTYVVPYELVVQNLILVSALSSVIFPTLTKLMQEKPDEWRPYFHKWLFRIGGLMLVVSVSLIFLMPHILELWLKHNFNPTSVTVGQILCAGIFFNSIGAMYYSMLHASGKSSVTTKIHIFEVPLYLIFLYFALHHFGVIGAAIAWASRMAVDTTLLFINAKRLKI